MFALGHVDVFFDFYLDFKKIAFSMLYWAPENRLFENKSDIGRKYLIPEQLALQAYDIIMQYFIRLMGITTLRNIIQ